MVVFGREQLEFTPSEPTSVAPNRIAKALCVGSETLDIKLPRRVAGGVSGVSR